jgi:hypothetical protein
MLLSLAGSEGIRVVARTHRFPPFERFLNRASMVLATRGNASREALPDIRALQVCARAQGNPGLIYAQYLAGGRR